MTLTKRDLARAIHRHDPEISVAAAVELVDVMIEAIKTALGRREKVMITNFGTFVATDRAARRGVNPATGARMVIEGHGVVIFRPSPGFLRALDA